MKILKEHTNGIVLCLFELLVGTLLLINPVGFTSWIIMIAGVVLMVIGLVEVIRYFKTSAKEAAISQTLAKGLILILAGGYCTFRTEGLIFSFAALTIIYGVAILVTGICKIQLTVDMLRRKHKKWFWAAINAVVSVISAVVILNSPFTSTAVLWMFTGVSLLVEGVLDVVTLIAGKKNEEGENV